MRLSPLTLFLAAFAAVAAADSAEERLGETEVPGEIAEENTVELDPPTIFNGVEVPPLLDIEGPEFNTTVKDGYWFVKHHSPYCAHCLHVKPTWQTLYEYYYTSKPVPAGSTVDDSATSMNTFTAYYKYHFANLDCIQWGDVCTKHNVHAFPTFILYKNGEEIQRFEGSKDMAGLSKFVEESLETIRPGSRIPGGPVLPATGDDHSADYQAPAAVPEVTETAAHLIATDTDKELRAAASNDVQKWTTSVLKATPVDDKPKKTKAAKPVVIANPLGKSTPFTAESFQNLVTMTQDPWFIKFYAPWCHHCQAVAPNWIQLAKEMRGKLNIGEVNCDVETRLCKDVHLRGYPSILFFRGGERVEYEGLRGLGDFISYANKAIDLGEGVKDIDALEFKELEEKEEVIFVYFYDHATTTEDFAALERLTLSLIGHAKLVKTNSAQLAERFKITTWPRLLVSRDGRPTYYTALAPQDMRDFRQVLHWMQSVWLPIVPELSASNSREIMDGKLVVLAILSREHTDEFIMAKKEIKSAALEWMDKETLNFQRERQELRDAKQLRIEEAEDRNDQRALRAAKSIRINMENSDHKEVGFAWVDGVFWERWIRTTYGIEVGKDGERVIINDEDNRRYWDTTITGNYIMASRTSILETIPKVISSPPKIQAKSTIGSFEKFFFDIRSTISRHPYLSIGGFIGFALGASMYWQKRTKRSRGGYFRLDEKDGLLGGSMNGNGKVD